MPCFCNKKKHIQIFIHFNVVFQTFPFLPSTLNAWLMIPTHSTFFLLSSLHTDSIIIKRFKEIESGLLSCFPSSHCCHFYGNSKNTLFSNSAGCFVSSLAQAVIEISSLILSRSLWPFSHSFVEDVFCGEIIRME